MKPSAAIIALGIVGAVLLILGVILGRQNPPPSYEANMTEITR